MRIIVFFDLPVETVLDRKNYSKFRKFLINEGFIMMQQSVYTKLTLNNSVTKSVKLKLSNNKPPKGLVQMLVITEKQFASIVLKEEIKGKRYDTIIVDEAQFLTKSHVEQLKDITIYKNIDVFCYGLKTNYVTQLFEGSKRLCELADSERELKSICKCKNKATINALKINNKVVKEVLGNCDILIGDTNSKDIYTYEPMCYKCWEEAETYKENVINEVKMMDFNIAQNESFVHKKVE